MKNGVPYYTMLLQTAEHSMLKAGKIIDKKANWL